MVTPVPEPPVVVNVMRVLTMLVVVALEIERVAWALKNVNVTAADVAEANLPCAAFVAVTEHEVEVEALS